MSKMVNVNVNSLYLYTLPTKKTVQEKKSLKTYTPIQDKKGQIRCNSQNPSHADKSHPHRASSYCCALYATGTFAETSSRGNPHSLRPSYV